MMKSFVAYLNKKISGREAYVVFIGAIVVHLLVVAVIHIVGFQPIRVADHANYHEKAVLVAHEWRSGNYSIEDDIVRVTNNYTYALAFTYSIIGDHEFAGVLIFSVFMAGLTAVLLYVLSRELGGSKKYAFYLSFIAPNVYLSFLYHTSFFSKEGLVTPLVLFALLSGIRMLKNTSWKRLGVFFIATFLLSMFKMPIGAIVLIALGVSVFFFRDISLQKKMIIGGYCVFLLAIIPLILGKGVFGFYRYSRELNFSNIAENREEGYSKTADSALGIRFEVPQDGEGGSPAAILAKNFGGYLYSILSTAFGPLPWQMNKSVYWVLLIETIPWYIVCFITIRYAVRNVRNKREILPIIVFFLGTICAIALISDNLGASTRLRIPAFLALMSLLPIALSYTRATKHENSLPHN